MSATTEFLNEVIKPLCDSFFDAHSGQFDLSENEGCGLYTEALVAYLRNQGYSKVGHLKKYGSATQYNGHANDAFLYREGDPTLYRAVDVIGAAESPPPYPPEGTNPRPSKNFGIDEPRYKDEDWMATPNAPTPVDVVPYAPYQGDASNAELKRTLAYDYARRPQGADFDVSVWAFRVQHSAVMGPLPPSQGGKPLGMSAAVTKHRPEWCEALHVPVVPVPPGWNIGDPV